MLHSKIIKHTKSELKHTLTNVFSLSLSLKGILSSSLIPPRVKSKSWKVCTFVEGSLHHQLILGRGGICAHLPKR